MRKNNLLIIATIFLLSISLESCKKNKGCTDKDSINYNTNATEDDGSCDYIAYIVFWNNSATSNHLSTSGYSKIDYYVNGVLAGSAQSSINFASAPACGASSSMTWKQDMGNNKSQTVNWSISANGVTLKSGSVSLTANNCYPVSWSF